MNRPRLLLILILLASTLHADEGMWLFNAAPVEKIKAAYGFTPTQARAVHGRLELPWRPPAAQSYVMPTGRRPLTLRASGAALSPAELQRTRRTRANPAGPADGRVR